MKALVLLKMARPSSTASTIVEKLSSASTMSAAVLATAVPIRATSQGDESGRRVRATSQGDESGPEHHHRYRQQQQQKQQKQQQQKQQKQGQQGLRLMKQQILAPLSKTY